MTDSPVDPVHDDHGEDPDQTADQTADQTPDQDAEPPTPLDNAPEPEASGTEHPDPPPGDDGM